MAQNEELFLYEPHHAGIAAAFFAALTAHAGAERGRGIFLTAERAYGSRRGRRMAMRALRDGNPLDLASYFAYGEILFTKDPTLKPGREELLADAVYKSPSDCLWAREFAALGVKETGALYCSEIDAAIVRGFNPQMKFECRRNLSMPGSRSCEFYFYGDVTPDFHAVVAARLNGRDERRTMAYHCADLYDMFCRVVRGVLPDAEEVRAEVRAKTAERYGSGFLPALDRFAGTDFYDIDSR